MTTTEKQIEAAPVTKVTSEKRDKDYRTLDAALLRLRLLSRLLF